jgi:hypothetical protein
MLQHFQADDFSREGIPFTVLQQLRSEATVVDQDFSSPPVLEVEGECTYYSPTDDMAMDKVSSVVLQVPPSLVKLAKAGTARVQQLDAGTVTLLEPAGQSCVLCAEQDVRKPGVPVTKSC